MAGLALSLGFLGGILLHDSGIGMVLAFPIVLGAVLVAILLESWPARALVSFVLIFMALGAWRGGQSPSPPPDVIVHLTGHDRAIDATVVGLPRRSTSRTKVTITLAAPPHSKIAASLPAFPGVRDGDVIEFWAPNSWDTGLPSQVRLPISPTGNDLFVPAFAIVGSSQSPVARVRRKVNDFVTRSISEHVPEPSGALTLGILTGDDSGMTDSTSTAFRSAGMSHITAVSGWNVAIVAAFFALIARRMALRRSLAVLLGLSMVWAYAFVVGMEPSVLRAAGMASVFLLAQWRGRPGDVLTALMLTTAAIVAITPAIRFDIGFQLSVAATLGLVLLLEVSQSWTWWHASLAVPFVAQIAVAPILLHQLGTYSVSSPLANLVAGPLVELVMAGGIATLIGTAVHPFIGDLAGAFTWVPARLIVAVAETTSRIRWSSSTTTTLSWPATFLVYASLILSYFGWAHLSRKLRPSKTSFAPIDRI